jgi:hypothetical protein
VSGDLSGTFDGPRFVSGANEPSGRLRLPAGAHRTVDGAEVRMLWTYAGDRLASTLPPARWLQQAASNGNRAPMLGPVTLRARAANRVLDVER